nr:immunoglobulin light chain junction region [Macaca mulatta]
DYYCIIWHNNVWVF